MIRVLFFDIGNVLLPFDPWIPLRRLAGNSPYSPEELGDLLSRWGRVADFECGRLSSEEFFRETHSYLKLDGLSQEQFVKIWSGIFLDRMLVRPETLRSLKQKYRLALISNTNPMHFRFAQEKYPALAEFDDAILSFRVGMMKPALSIFEEAVARSGCAPEETFFIDDIEANVRAARSVGIPSVRFESEEQLLAEFKKRGIDAGDEFMRPPDGP